MWTWAEEEEEKSCRDSQVEKKKKKKKMKNAKGSIIEMEAKNVNGQSAEKIKYQTVCGVNS
jgi:hypothetical protein